MSDPLGDDATHDAHDELPTHSHSKYGLAAFFRSRIRIVGIALTSLSVGIALVLPVSNFAAELGHSFLVWSFDADPPDTLPQDFQIGTLYDGRPAGEWKVLKTDAAKSPPHVLGQLMGKGAEHAYKTVLVNGTDSSDLELSVSLLPIDGKADMGGGLIWRATDDRNYYLTRANPLEQNIRIYRVIKGVRQMIQNFDHIIDVRTWHKLDVVMEGCRVQVLFDEKQIFELCDKTFKEGRVGLWTKADAVTYFDNLKLQRLK